MSDPPRHLADVDAWRALRAGARGPHQHRQIAVEVLVRDESGRFLLVRDADEGGWVLPRRVVAPGEAPLDASRRVVGEATGAPGGRLLVIDCAGQDRGTAPSMILVIDGGTATAAPLQDRFTFRAEPTAQRLLPRATAGRLSAAAEALNETVPVVRQGATQHPSCKEALALWLETAGWVLSDELLRIDHSVSYPITIKRVDGDRVVLSRDADTLTALPFGLFWPDGHALVTPEVRDLDEEVERTVARVTAGTLRPGLCAFVSSHLFGADPAATHGIEFTEVTINGELGPLPAWRVPPAGQNHGSAAAGTWVVAVHGRGASRAEALRVLPTLATAGVRTLVVSYRNDREAPSSPDGLCHLGDTEWRDIESAVRYANRHGASRIVLYGWSMGAMAAMTALHRMSRDDAALVRGIVLDSPVLDWAATLAWQATRRGVPPPLAATTLRLITQRARLDLPELDHVGFAARLQVPVLLFVDLADRTAPPEPALRFGRARPDLVTLVTTDVGHGRSWNQNPPRYEAAIRDFLAHLG